jgi:hypothetical protein
MFGMSDVFTALKFETSFFLLLSRNSSAWSEQAALQPKPQISTAATATSLYAFHFNDIALNFGIRCYNIIQFLSTLHISYPVIPSLFFIINRF